MSDLDRRRQLLLRRRKAIFASENLLDFAQYLHPDKQFPDDISKSGYEIATHHRAIADALMKVLRGDIKRLIINCPPRHGKTLLANHMFGAFFAGAFPGKHLIIGTYNEKFAWDHGRAIRRLIKSKLYGQVFPRQSVVGRGSVERFELDTGSVLQFVGRGGTITGRGGHIIVIDDPIKNRKEADSPTIRDELWAWYTNDIASRQMDKNAAIIIIQTRWHEDDLVGRLTDPNNPNYVESEAKQWYIVDLPALAEDDDPLDRAVGEPLWPSRFDRPFFDKIAATDARAFQALYQGRPAPDEGVFFKADWLQTYARMDEVPPMDKLRFYAASDHAVGLTQDRDSTVLMVVGVDTANRIWVMPDIFWGRHPTDLVVEAMLNLMAKYKPVYWWAERGHITKSIGPFLRKRMLERSIYCTVDEVVPSIDKQQRAQSIMGRMAMGLVYWPAFTQWWPKAQSQLLKFPRGISDDLVDTCSLVGMGLERQFGKRPVSRHTAAPGEFPKLTFGDLKKEARRKHGIAQLQGW